MSYSREPAQREWASGNSSKKTWRASSGWPAESDAIREGIKVTVPIMTFNRPITHLRVLAILSEGAIGRDGNDQRDVPGSYRIYAPAYFKMLIMEDSLIGVWMIVAMRASLSDMRASERMAIARNAKSPDRLDIIQSRKASGRLVTPPA